MERFRLPGALGACLLLLSFYSITTHAALVGRDLDGNLSTAEAYYDTVAGLTWLADANYAGTTMNWTTANSWAAGLDPYSSGITGWRLPDTLQPDASCDSQSGGDSYGYNCTGSEMGNLFYNVLGGVAGSSIATTHNANYDLFSNVQSSVYWSATGYAPNTAYAWRFRFDYGGQDFNGKTLSLYAWAVHSGDVGASMVPVPAAVWLFGSGLLGLVGLGRQRRR